MVVGELGQIRVGDGLAIGHGHTVVPQRTVAWQCGDLHRAAGVVWVCDGEIATRCAYHRDGSAHKQHTRFAFDQGDAAAGRWDLVGGRDVYRHGLERQQAARAVIDRDLKGVCRGR